MNKKGFSLIELLVVIVLIAIISVVAFVNFGNQAPKGRNSVRLNDLSTITSALEIARADKEYSLAAVKVGGTNFSDVLAGTESAFSGTLTAEQLSDVTKNASLLRTYLAKSPVDPSATGSTSSKTYKIGGTSTSYQLAASLEKVGNTGDNTKLGAYSTDRVNAITVGNFVPSATFSVETNGDVTATSTGAANTLGLIAKDTVDEAAYTAITDVSAGATSIVVDGSTNLPY